MTNRSRDKSLTEEQREQLLALADLDYEAAQQALDRCTSAVYRSRTIGITVFGVVLAIAVQQDKSIIALLALGLAVVLALIDGFQSKNLHETLEHCRRLERIRRMDFAATLRPADQAETEKLVDRLGGIKLGSALIQLHDFQIRDLRYSRPRVVFGILYPSLVGVASITTVVLALGHGVSTLRILLCVVAVLAAAVALGLFWIRPASGRVPSRLYRGLCQATRHGVVALSGVLLLLSGIAVATEANLPYWFVDRKAPELTVSLPPGSHGVSVAVISRPQSCGESQPVELSITWRSGRTQRNSARAPLAVTASEIESSSMRGHNVSSKGNTAVRNVSVAPGAARAQFGLLANWTFARHGGCTLALPAIATPGLEQSAAVASSTVDPTNGVHLKSKRSVPVTCDPVGQPVNCGKDIPLNRGSTTESTALAAGLGGLGVTLLLAWMYMRWPDQRRKCPGEQ